MKNNNIIVLPLIPKIAESNYLSTNKDEKEIKKKNNNNPLKIRINIIIIIINNGYWARSPIFLLVELDLKKNLGFLGFFGFFGFFWVFWVFWVFSGFFGFFGFFGLLNYFFVVSLKKI